MFDQYKQPNQSDGLAELYAPETVPGQWLGLFPFFVPMLLYIIMKLSFLISPTLFYSNEWLSSILLNLVLLVYLVVYVFGWKKGFPRWWFSYPIAMILFSTIMENAFSPGVWILGFRSEDAVWGWRAWIPLIVTTLLAVLISPFPGTYRKLWQGIWHDPSRLSFLFYGALPFWSIFIFDEVADKVTTPVLGVSFILFFFGAFFYLRAKLPWHRIGFLFGTAFLTSLMQYVVLGIYWIGREEFWMTVPVSWKEQITGTTYGLYMLTMVLLAPALLVEVGKIIRRRNKINPNRPNPAHGL